ncbi:LOW QUALITY PROTEIN: basement membrane-specific heparan sulfate proteoglycan core protein-like [Liolophura sinensis]|uniref:LOW QUALITY PROTEIN: basement membrane-specific heparan sulfate proteoglycan core protein-like n=1 Tax=Liolophura sinensis TaxID=3198878 RepID=UPI00315894C5
MAYCTGCLRTLFIYVLIVYSLGITVSQQLHEKDFEFTDVAEHSVKKRAVDSTLQDDEDFLNDQSDGSGNDEEEGSTTLSPIPVPDYPEYYRVTINFTSLTYEDALASRITSRFQQLARLLSLDIEQLYATTEGQQMATVIQFQPSGSGVLVSLDLGTQGYYDRQQLYSTLNSVVNDGYLGANRVSPLGFGFRELRRETTTRRGDLPGPTCAANQYPCVDGTCIPSAYRCDNQQDCPDGSDELNCPTAPPSCRPGEFQCVTGECISSSQVCDRNPDCLDVSDERNCPPVGPGCGPDEYRCSDGSCIPVLNRCDSRADCPDGGDEFNCPSVPCGNNEFRCERGKCIDVRLRCDGRVDCPESSDELDCTACLGRAFRCDNGQCVASGSNCNGVRDCNDGSDEEGCLPASCVEGLYRCDNGQCIDNAARCNGIDECADGSDERNCRCPPGDFRCRDGTCIPERVRCDAIQDCDDGSDEVDCEGCADSEFTCVDGTCIDGRRKCDRIPDCAGGEDEEGCVIGRQCREDEFSCRNGQCIELPLFCDRKPDCSDASDEEDCPECREDEFKCRDGTCIDAQRRCNRVPECPDRSDEEGCECRDSEFTCRDGTCIDSRLRCNGIPECPDRTDEADCACRRDQFRCNDGTCIDARRRCNRYPECPDRSDEANCPCDDPDFRCGDGSCLDGARRCDGRSDCPDGSDERNCPRRCEQGDFYCKSGECIDPRRRCDGRVDCRDRSDEEDCRPRCSPGEFVCSSNGQCLDPRRRCDGRTDCPDASDELGCPPETCGPNEFTCGNGGCIDVRRKCDGRNDCGDNTDEDDCVPVTCSQAKFTCENGRCIDIRRKCDGRNDCGDNTDEDDCAPPTCRQDQFTCDNGQCIDERRKCDGRNDCGDNTDETSCPVQCGGSEYRCRTGQCIDSRRRCDGRRDCPDNSDEDNCRPITVVVSPPRLVVRVGQDITIQCSATGGANREYVVQWSFQGRALPARSSEVGGRLTIPGVTAVDSGEYTCTVIGIPGSYRAIAVVSVQEVGPTQRPTTEGPCGRDQSTCQNGQCIPRAYVCDGERDCRDGSDEENCVRLPCEPNEYKCNSGKCIMKIWRCDGDNDCGDNSDEQNCGTTAPGAPCRYDEYQCVSGNQCVPASYQCDGEIDCVDRSDEIGCAGPTITVPPPPNVEVEIGGSFTIVCEAVGVPTPLIVWRLNWGNIPQGQRVRTTSVNGRGTLTITNLIDSDQGAYTCEAINTKGSVFATPDAIIITRVTPGLCSPPLYNAEAKDQSQCYQCFCFGQTKKCYSSGLSVSQIALGSELQVIRRDTKQAIEQAFIRSYPNKREFGISDFSRVLPTGSYYWNLPVQYLGNKLSSYGGDLKYNIYYEKIGEDQPTGDPDAIISGNGITLFYRAFQGPTAGVQENVVIPLVESAWARADGRRRGDIEPDAEIASRGDLMMVLENVTEILIRATYDVAQTESRIGNILLTTAVTRDTGRGRAISVEECTCPTGYTGLSCEKCAPGFFRVNRGEYLGDCLPCNCHGHSNDCDPLTGACSRCIHNTAGPRCDRCADGYYGDARRGSPNDCQPCACPLTIPSNRFSPTCALGGDGQMRCTACPPGYEGRQCERCSIGYVGNPSVPGDSCRPDSGDRCDDRGTQDGSLIQGGVCRCKENVEGPLCSSCQRNTFYLSDSNPLGCISCFCMGMTQTCTSTSWNRAQISATFTTDRAGFMLTDMMRRQTVEEGFSVNYNTRDLSYRAFSNLPQITHYWFLPERFLGNKVTAYGGYLRYTVTYRPGFDNTPRSDPDVEIIGNDIVLIYRHTSPVDPNTPQSFQVPLYEQYWIRSDGEPATREHLLMALADVSAILIKATYTATTTESSIRDVTLDIAENRVTGQDRAFAVEQCVCPRGYRGLSCQDCDTGYTRTGGGLYLGLCEPCQCNGHSNECDPETGVCRNCQHNTEGDRCERCGSGYFGDASRGSTADCQQCPCPLTVSPNQFSPTCILDNDGQVTCTACPAGHTGRRCESCLPGYQGNPLRPGSYCQQVTDRPRGFQSAEGVECNCDLRGTVPNTQCDERGQCQCKAFVQGTRCTTCKDGYFHLSQSNPQGCLECFCMGVTDRCSSSNYFRDTIRPLINPDGTHNFVLTNRRMSNMISDGFAVNAATGEFSFDNFREVQRERESLFFALPAKFKGDKVSSYGGKLTFTLEYTASEEGSKYMDVDVEIVSGNQRMYLLFDPSISRGQTQRYEITMDESSFRMVDGSMPSREGFLSIVANIEAFLIRATYETVMVSATIRDVSLDIAVPQPTGLGEAPMVESCSCPEGYSGLSCQTCAAGYLRVQDTTTPLGRCIRCNCNGHGTSCDPQTGRCLSCQHNTDGERCERCAPGFYGDATVGTPNDCRPCACPLTIPSNRFSPVCHLEQDGQLTCDRCQQGYTGRDCGECAQGYRGNPRELGGRCERSTDSLRPRVSVTPVRIQEPIGGTVVISCRVDGRGPFNVVWARADGRPVAPRGRVGPSNELTIRNLVPSDSGRYVCTATNTYGSERDNTELTVVAVEQVSVRIEEPKTVTVDQGQSVQFVCRGASQVSYTLAWTKRGGSLPAKALDQNGVLFIPNVQREDSGTYVCTGSNVHGISTDIAILTVGSTSSPPEVRIEPRYQTVEVGNPVEFRCIATGSPQPTVEWSKGGTGQLTPGATFDGGVFRIASVTRADEAEYYCKATNTAGTTTVRTILYVTGESVTIDIIIRNTKVVAREGGTARLECSTRDAEAVLVWTKAVGALPPGSQQENGVLTIPDVRPAYSGQYVCSGTNPSGGSGRSVAVLEITAGGETIKERPSATIDPDRQEVAEGHTGTLRCIVTGEPKPTVTWARARGDLSPNHQVDGEILRITQATMEDRGIYVCRADNVAGRAQASAVVEVARRRRPKIEVYPEPEMTVQRGGSVLFQCRVMAGDPPPKVVWTRAGNEPFTDNTEILENGVIRFMSVTGAEQGAYICTAENGMGTITVTANLRIKGPPRIRVSPGNVVRVREGDSVRIECTAEGDPTPSVYWHERRETFPVAAGADAIPRQLGSAVLALNQVTRRDAGTFTCIAENTGGRVDQRIQLIVEERQVPATTGLTIAGPDLVNVVEGQTLELRCAAAGILAPILRWSRREGALPPDHTVQQGILTIPSITGAYQGEYICSVITPTQSYEATVTIIISVSPRLTISPARVSARPGSPLYLRCSSQGTPPINIEWSKVNGILSPSAVERDGILEIRQVTAADAGQYRCVATNQAGSAEGIAEVIISVPPTVVVSQKNYVHTVGEFVELRCRATGSPPPRVTWEKELGTLPPRHDIQNGILQIYSVSAADEGRYICTASNEAGSTRDYAYLTVQDVGGPSTGIKTDTQTVDVGDRVEFECIVTGTPRPTIQWNKLGGVIPPRAVIGEGILIIPQVQPEDAGTYRCTATNMAGSVQSQVVLFVRARPVISIPQNIRTAALGSTANLNCDAQGFPQPAITWNRREGQLPGDHIVRNGELTIPTVRREDAGTYVCSAANDYGITEHPVQLVVGDLVPYFSQNPVSYISYAPLRDAYLNFDMLVSFRPEATDGLVLYNGQSDTGIGDFLCFGLQDSYPEFRFDVGSGPAIIRGNRSLELNRWHTVKLKRDRKLGTMVVNDEPSYMGEAQGRFVGLDLEDSLYLGAVPDFARIPQAAGFRSGFVGTVSQMELQGDSIDLGEEARSLVGIREYQVCRDSPCENGGTCEPANTNYGYRCNCPQGYAGRRCELSGERCYPGACGSEGRCYNQPGLSGYLCICPIGKTGPGCQVEVNIVDPFFNKTSFISYPTIQNGRLQVTISLSFKPRSLDDGIIFYNGQREDGAGDFVALVMKDGHVEFRYNTGSGPAILVSPDKLPVDEWALVSAQRNGRDGSLTVNNGRTIKATLRDNFYYYYNGHNRHKNGRNGRRRGSSRGSTLGLNLRLPMYLGGIDPAYSVSSDAGVASGLVGCISDLVINGEEVDIVESSQESANVQNCGDRSPCDKRPCQNSGICEKVDETNYKCVCPAEYTGRNCETEVNICITDQPCRNGARCSVGEDGYRCFCPLGFSGRNCEDAIQLGQRFNIQGNGYVELPKTLLPHRSGQVREVVNLTITTDYGEGLIFWHGQEPDQPLRGGDYLAIALSDGYVVFMYELGSGPARIISAQRVDDGQPHRITTTRLGRSGTIQIDDGEVVSGESKGILQMLNVKGSVFIGGVPDLSLMTDGKFTENISGCVQDIGLLDKGPIDIDSQAVGGFNVGPCLG